MHALAPRCASLLIVICALLGSVASAQTPFMTLPFASGDAVLTEGFVYVTPTMPPAPPTYCVQYGNLCHRGIDYANGGKPFPVRAVADGAAIASKNASFGTFVYIAHDEFDSSGLRYFTLYAHLEDGSTGSLPTETTGQLSADAANGNFTGWKTVVRGQLLGTASDTGFAEGVHLHLEVHRGGYVMNKTDPYAVYGNRFAYPGNCTGAYLWLSCPPQSPATIPTPPTFAGRFDIVTAAGTPVGLAVADFDGDGRKDIAATIYNNGSGNQVVIYRNTSSPGALAFDQPVTLTTDGGPEGIVAVDLDGDGKMDLAVANASGGTVTIFHNVSTPGSVAFSPAGRFFIPTAHRIAVADFDGDGKPDLIVTSNGGETVTVLRNASSLGNISFDTQTSFSTQSFPNQVAVADIDGDGRPDILVPIGNASKLEVYLNTSTPGNVSVAPAQFFATGAEPEGIAVGDLTGDGKPEVLVPAGGGNTLGVFTNSSGIGSLSLQRSDLPVGNRPDAVSVGDLEKSGLLDVVVLNGSDNTFTVFHNASTGGSLSLAPLPAVTTSLSPVSLALADIDGDGWLDVVVTNEISGSISVFLNLGGQQ
jgi:hypothetical protein